MSIPVIVELAAAAISAVALVWPALYLKRDRPASRAKMALRFAGLAGLTILPDVTDWVGGRVRRRAQTKIALVGRLSRWWPSSGSIWTLIRPAWAGCPMRDRLRSPDRDEVGKVSDVCEAR